jgi:hypothetical protein
VERIEIRGFLFCYAAIATLTNIQIPTSNIQKSTKVSKPRFRFVWKLEVWNLSGIWMLVFGGSDCRFEIFALKLSLRWEKVLSKHAYAPFASSHRAEQEL